MEPNSKTSYGEVFEKLKTEKKFTPIYPTQCYGRIKGFHKFLKATIAKQLETCFEWDDLVWKATAAYNFFPTESSGAAPFFLMFGCEEAVKHNLLESEKPKYLGTDDGMINIELMKKLYHIVAHNLNEARKVRDKNKKDRTAKEPEKLKIGDNTSHIESISAQVQRLLHSRTSRKKTGRDQRQPWPHNQGLSQRC